jgi:hypothetical protein
MKSIIFSIKAVFCINTTGMGTLASIPTSRVTDEYQQSKHADNHKRIERRTLPAIIGSMVSVPIYEAADACASNAPVKAKREDAYTVLSSRSGDLRTSGSDKRFEFQSVAT